MVVRGSNNSVAFLWHGFTFKTSIRLCVYTHSSGCVTHTRAVYMFECTKFSVPAYFFVCSFTFVFTCSFGRESDVRSEQALRSGFVASECGNTYS